MDTHHCLQGAHAWALIFDGVLLAPSAACAEPAIEKALAAAETACKARGWDIKLAEKPLHGRQDEQPKTIRRAREALESWAYRQAAAEGGGGW